MSRLKTLIQEIHRRSLWQVLGIYVGGAWVALQGIEALVSVLGLPEWVPGFALVVMIMGLPIVLATAFVQEGVGAGEAPAEAPAEVEGLHLVLTWKNVALGGLALVALAGVGVAGWLLLGGEIAGSPETIRSIAVLPLENLTGDPGQEYFADGMTEAVISEFARLGALNVISRTSVMRYKQSDKSLPEIAQELNVEGVVEGSVFRAGDRVRITLQLIDARSDLHLWARSYERNLRDVLVLQGEIARTVAEQIQLELSSGEQAALTVSRAVNPQAYDAYLRGLQLRGPVTLVRAWGPPAIEQFKQAVALDSNFAEGYAALALSQQTLATVGHNARYWTEFPRARQAAQRALEIDDRLGGAHATLGFILWCHDWDFPGARRALERAIQLSPNDQEALGGYAWFLLAVDGRTQDALAVSDRLMQVAPFDLYSRSERIGHFFYARQYERALEEVELVRELAPDYVDSNIADIYFMLGRLEQEHQERVDYYRHCGTPCNWALEARERGWADGRWEGSVRAWLGAATRREGFAPFQIAMRYTMIDDREEAFSWLERGYRERDSMMAFLKGSPSFDSLRSDPRFDDLLRRIGFPEE